MPMSPQNGRYKKKTWESYFAYPQIQALAAFYRDKQGS